jgi:hypothetical protein
MGVINQYNPVLVLIKVCVTESNILRLWYQMVLRYAVIKHWKVNVLVWEHANKMRANWFVLHLLLQRTGEYLWLLRPCISCMYDLCQDLDNGVELLMKVVLRYSSLGKQTLMAISLKNFQLQCVEIMQLLFLRFIIIIIIIIVVFQRLGLLTYSGSEFIFLKLRNLLDSW